MELTRDYDQIDHRYTKEYAKLQTKLAMVTDLTTCFKATDNGVMKFHQYKMKQINRTIDELWKKTYMGNDIETIQIRADQSTTKKADSTTRSYNYRVVMVKNGVELDMRGRCSAGQRVLASIIIRLSLAENFGTNFGVIALDEPTTNLDEDNINSLAQSLNALIELRKQQSNFQIIVITHDEKFMSEMGAQNYTEHFYKVQRNQRLNSTISQCKISD
ncbi:unnamed protein product [Ambrosiozyma monospora]|uniref:Unnamed protein product n=1 Tax=Ambrosiozyma monospora TaxID=43982 RepID=A0ACB5TE10_AMBMO|nr:unnamed protein product [Ambrosiozyma monospora]